MWLASIAPATRSETGFPNAQMHFNQVVRLAAATEPCRASYILDDLTELPRQAAKGIPQSRFAATRPSPGAGSHYRISGGFLT